MTNVELETLLVELPARGPLRLSLSRKQRFWCENEKKIFVFSCFSLAGQIKWYDGIPRIVATWMHKAYKTNSYNEQLPTWKFICHAAGTFVLLNWQWYPFPKMKGWPPLITSLWWLLMLLRWPQFLRKREWIVCKWCSQPMTDLSWLLV